MNIHLNSVFSTNMNSVGINYTVSFIIQKYGFKGISAFTIILYQYCISLLSVHFQPQCYFIYINTLKLVYSPCTLQYKIVLSNKLTLSSTINLTFYHSSYVKCSDPVIAKNSILTKLTSSVTSGAFDTALKSTGAI